MSTLYLRGNVRATIIYNYCPTKESTSINMLYYNHSYDDCKHKHVLALKLQATPCRSVIGAGTEGPVPTFRGESEASSQLPPRIWFFSGLMCFSFINTNCY